MKDEVDQGPEGPPAKDDTGRVWLGRLATGNRWSAYLAAACLAWGCTGILQGLHLLAVFYLPGISAFVFLGAIGLAFREGRIRVGGGHDLDFPAIAAAGGLALVWGGVIFASFLLSVTLHPGQWS